jgi:hypothetical protein
MSFRSVFNRPLLQMEVTYNLRAQHNQHNNNTPPIELPHVPSYIFISNMKNIW